MTPLPNAPKNKRRCHWLAVIAVLPILFSSCEESDLFVLLNPDGSGRITNKERIRTSHLGINNPQVLQARAVSEVGKFVEDSKGVDAWENVSFSITQKGDIEVTMTALFPDISKLELATSAEESNLLSGLKYDRGDKTKKRPASIELACPITRFPQQKLPGGAPPDKQKIAEELAKTRRVWAEQEKNIRPSWGKRRSKVTLHLPGNITSSSNFTKDAKNQVSLQVTAPKLIDTLGKIITDDKIATEVLKTGGKIMDNYVAPPVKPTTFNKLTFGEEKPIRVEFSGETQFFNYKNAVATAKANPNELLQLIQELIERDKRK